MRKPLAVLALITPLLVSPLGTARADVDVHINLGVPPPPVVVYEQEPKVVLVPRSRVYYAPSPDYDLFRYGNEWYVNRDGYWYSSRSYRGPFVSVRYEQVPRAIVLAPPKYHRYPVRPRHSNDGHRGGKKHGENHRPRHDGGHPHHDD